MFITDQSMTMKIGQTKTIVFASNGSLKKDGSNVMGKGVGHALSHVVSTLPQIFGKAVKQNGNKCYSVKFMSFTFISFPTKHNYWETEDRNLILQSIEDLKPLLKDLGGEISIEYPYLDKHMDTEVLEKLESLGDNVCVYLK